MLPCYSNNKVHIEIKVGNPDDWYTQNCLRHHHHHHHHHQNVLASVVVSHFSVLSKFLIVANSYKPLGCTPRLKHKTKRQYTNMMTKTQIHIDTSFTITIINIIIIDAITIIVITIKRQRWSGVWLMRAEPVIWEQVRTILVLETIIIWSSSSSSSAHHHQHITWSSSSTTLSEHYQIIIKAHRHHLLLRILVVSSFVKSKT